MNDGLLHLHLSPRVKALVDVLDGLSGRSYALLDAAVSSGLMRWIESCDLKVQSLYSGTSAVTLREQAPYLVDLSTTNEKRHLSVAALLELGWGQHLMLLLKSDASFNELRIHLKKKLVVRNEQGQRLYFRFYDPRVARSFLAANTYEGLAFYFEGGVQAYIMENLDAQAVIITRSNSLLTTSYDSHTYLIPPAQTNDELQTLPPNLDTILTYSGSNAEMQGISA